MLSDFAVTVSFPLRGDNITDRQTEIDVRLAGLETAAAAAATTEPVVCPAVSNWVYFRFPNAFTLVMFVYSSIERQKYRNNL